MQIEQLRSEYVKLRDQSGLAYEVFRRRVVRQIAATGLEGPPWVEDFITAAREVLLQARGPQPQPQPSPDSDQQPEQSQSVDPMPELNLRNQSRAVLKLEPSRFAVINIETQGPRMRRQLDRSTRTLENGSRPARYSDVESVTVRTTSETTIINPLEHEAAKKLGGQIGYMLRRMGTRIVDGVIAFPIRTEEAFDSEHDKARDMARAFNSSSTHWKVLVNAFKLDASSPADEEIMARKVAYEVQQLMAEMKSALDSLDVDRIREVATEAKAKALAIAPGVQQGALYAAVESARKAATKASRDLKDKGKQIELIRRELDTSAIESARFMFLELAVPEEVDASQPGVQSSGIDGARFSGLGVE